MKFEAGTIIAFYTGGPIVLGEVLEDEGNFVKLKEPIMLLPMPQQDGTTQYGPSRVPTAAREIIYTKAAAMYSEECKEGGDLLKSYEHAKKAISSQESGIIVPGQDGGMEVPPHILNEIDSKLRT